MTVSRVDPQSLSTRAALEGGCALDAGDTVLAKQKYTEAGDILDRGSRKQLPAADKHLLRFLAASQYYRAGEYKKALKLAERVNPGHLRPGHRELLADFRKDVAERTAEGYENRIRLAVVAHWKKGEADAAFRLLRDHPYVVDRTTLALARADLCCMMGQYRPTALYSADAVRFSDQRPTPVFRRVVVASWLHDTRGLQVASEYTQLLLVQHPTALDFVTASVFRFDALQTGDLSAGAEVLRLFGRAEEAFDKLPPATQTHPHIQAVMAHGYALAALAADRMGDIERAMKLATAGANFQPFAEFRAAYQDLRSQPAGSYTRLADRIAAMPVGLLTQQSPQATFESAFLNAA